MRPWMDNTDISKIEALLLSRFGKSKDTISVLEWGAGGSTEHFGKFLSKNGVRYEWNSIEYNKKWNDKILALNLPHTSITLFDVGNDSLKQRDTNMDDYVDYPNTLGKEFDFILVDGRKRRRCLLEASKLVKTNGIVMLHDAERKYYHCAFSAFSSHKLLTKTLWMGENNG